MSKKSPYSQALINSKFWQDKTLAQMNREEWEAICDGCARCCLHKFIHDDSLKEEDEFSPSDTLHEGEEVIYTNIACHLLNDKTCSCSQYDKRSELVPDCVTLSKDNIESVFFMPTSCSYRRLHEGKGLAHWHPLLNKGKKSKMHTLGITVRNRTVCESDVNLEDFEDYIVTWPLDSAE